MRSVISSLGLLGSTLAWLALIYLAHPFERAREALDAAFHAAPAWTQVANLLRDPLIAELSRGDSPVASFETLAGYWGQHPDARKFILMGNSQSLLMSLAPGEPPGSVPEQTYCDIIAYRFRADRSNRLFYRLSAGALSYEEMLWYAEYLVTKPTLKPDVLLVQVNYQNFMNGGIRPGMLELASDGAFRKRIEEAVRSGAPDSFGLALRRLASPNTSAAAAAPATPGDRLETLARARLEVIPVVRDRGNMYASFLDDLVRGRTYILHLGLATKRSLKGSRVDESRAALERLADLCAASGIQMVLFQAPTNPAVPIYATPDDESEYHAFVNSLAARHRVHLFDFEHSIPAQFWGMTMNVPDPLHLGREAHRVMAAQMLSSIERNGL